MPQNLQQSSSTEGLTRVERVRHLGFLIWAIIGIVLLVVAVGFLLGQVLPALYIIGFAALIVFILRVPVAWLEQRKVPRWLGSLIAYLGSLLIIALVMLLFIPLIWEQAIGLIKLFPEYANEATVAFNDFYQRYSYLLADSNIQQVVGSLTSALSGWAGNMVSSSAQGVIALGTNVVMGIVVFTMALIVGFWILKDLPMIGRELRIIIGPKHEEGAVLVASAFSRAFGGYLRGITVAGLCTGTIAGIGYYFIGLPYPAVLGLLTGFMNFIPYVGPWVSGTLTALIGLFVSPLAALLAIAITLLAQQLTDNFITPRVMSSVVELHPVLVLVGVFAGGMLGGIPGLIVAVPLLASAKNIFVYYFEKHTDRRLVDENGVFFKGRPAPDSTDDGHVVDAVADAVGSTSRPSRPSRTKNRAANRTKNRAESRVADTGEATGETRGHTDTDIDAVHDAGADAETPHALASSAPTAKTERANRENE
jgi:predicted PurR-regulated permease PerM